MLHQHKSVLIYLTGKPGVGKYTVAKELAQYGFIVCDNQLVNNPIFSLLNYDGFTPIPAHAWRAIARIRDVVLSFIATEEQTNYVLTNNLYEDAGDRGLYDQVKDIAHLRDSLFIPVRLNVSPEEHLKRVSQPERRMRWKSVDPQEVYDKKPLLTIDDPYFLELNIDALPAQETAQQIWTHVQSIQTSPGR